MATEPESELCSNIETANGAPSGPEASGTDVIPKPASNPIAELEANRLQLAITIENLSLSRPNILKNLVAVVLALILLLASLIAAMLRYFNTDFPSAISTIGAFAAVIFAYWLYASYRAFAIENEKSQRYKVLLEKNKHLAKLTDQFLTEEASLRDGEGNHGE